MSKNKLIRSFLRACFAASIWSLLALPAASFAQSACTGMWAILNNGAPATSLAYYNNSAGTASKWTAVPIALNSGTTTPNALAADNAGNLYYFDRTGLGVYSINLNTGVQSGPFSIAPALGGTFGNAAILGAAVDAAGNLVFLSNTSTLTPADQPYALAVINKTANTTAVVWKTITNPNGTNFLPGAGSGDIYLDAAGQMWLAINTNPPAAYRLTLTITGGVVSSAVVGASVSYNITPAIGTSSVGVNPLTGLTYLGSATAGQTTYQITPTTANSQVLVDATNSANYLLNDIGSCPTAPASPSVTKSFSPSFQAFTGTTTTLVVNLANTNTAPVWLTAPLNDPLPAGMTIANPANLNAGTCSASVLSTNTFTATPGANTWSFAAGGRIPAGGCTVTMSITAPASATPYVNTIPAGSLTTTAGNNLTTATATFVVGTDFSVSKTQGPGTAGPYSSGALSTPGGQTMQYVLTISNSSVGGTGSATFSDSMPTQLTPVLSITSAMTGGGSCSTANTVIGGATVITGTLTNAPASAFCTVTVTTKVSAALSTATSVTNTLTVAAMASTSDTNAANNTATVATTIGSSAQLAVAKSNGVTSSVAGSTTSYTITVANFGPASAAGTVLTDPAVAGLNCTTVTCTSTAANMCPATPTVAALRSTGLQVTPSFPANSTASFVVTCGVTATGR